MNTMDVGVHILSIDSESNPWGLLFYSLKSTSKIGRFRGFCLSMIGRYLFKVEFKRLKSIPKRYLYFPHTNEESLKLASYICGMYQRIIGKPLHIMVDQECVLGWEKKELYEKGCNLEPSGFPVADYILRGFLKKFR